MRSFQVGDMVRFPVAIPTGTTFHLGTIVEPIRPKPGYIEVRSSRGGYYTVRLDEACSQPSQDVLRAWHIEEEVGGRTVSQCWVDWGKA